MSEKPVALFPGKQNELIAVTQIAVRSYRESQLVLAAHKGKYTVQWGVDLEAQLNACKNMRNFQARNARAEEIKVRMNVKNKLICEAWQGLKLYIADVPDWNDIQKQKLEEAGWLLYDSAYKENWSSTLELISTANVFMSTYAADLETPINMPNNFRPDFAQLGSDFNDLYNEFEDANQDSEVETNARVTAYNNLYAVVIAMFADGAYVYRNDDGMKKRFIYAAVLDKVRGASTPIKTFKVEPNNKVKVERVVSGSSITNSGAVTLWIQAGLVEVQGPGAVELLPEAEMPAPGETFTAFNNETSAGEFEARVVVD